MTETRCVAVVGSREASPDGIRRAERLARELVDRSFTVVSGLARGIDSAAHRAALAPVRHPLYVVGTSLESCYPKQPADLPEEISGNHHLIPDVSVRTSAKPHPHHHRPHSPDHNLTIAP